jgi:HEPN domain-containing protein
MKTQLPLSGQSQKEHFSAFTKDLVEKFKPLHIYCFGKTVELTNKEGCFIDNAIQENYQYFLLMVTENVTRIEHEVQDYANSHYPYGIVTILVHGKETIAEAIKANNKFFITIYNTAHLIFSHDGMVQSVPVESFIPTQAAVKAKKHFHHRILLASGFLESAKECQRKQLYQLSVFMLHQAVEQCCIALIRVHLAYRSDIHNLYRQLRLCNSFSPAPSRLFFSGREDDKRLFDIMVKSYSAARYKDDFEVEQSDAEQLYIQVSIFLDLTDMMCGKKIDVLSNEAELYKQLKEEGEVCHA